MDNQTTKRKKAVKQPVQEPVPEPGQVSPAGIQAGLGADQIAQFKAQRGAQQPEQGGNVVPDAADEPNASTYSPTIIGPEEIKDATATLARYESGRAMLKQRIIDNESWYRLRHWQQIVKPAGGKPNKSDPEPTSAWLFNSLANKHADAMDNFPEPTVLPREASDKGDAEMLTSIIPTILDQNGFE
ncbi:MAG TPA: hypothetical protein PKJ47_13775, partial [Candidatus Limiplasma sp.]|nr:hypothetical protein [Candidatus Limiplasma sp.]